MVLTLQNNDLHFVINHSISCISKFAATEKSLVKGWEDVDHVGWCPYIEEEFCEFGCLGCGACGEMNTLDEGYGGVFEGIMRCSCGGGCPCVADC